MDTILPKFFSDGQQDNEDLYRILIVDDEEPFRKGFRYSINWKDFGFKVATEASNAIDAIKLLENNYYDVLITDISMPEKSGIELIESVREKYPRLKIFIISGYSDFDYAVSAIKLNVDDYILKPIKKDQIEVRFKKLKEELDREKEEITRKNTGNRAARSNFLHHLVQNDYTSIEKILSIVDKLEICLPDGATCIINLKLRDLNLFIDRYFNGSYDAFEAKIEESADKSLPGSSNAMLTTFISNNFIFLVPYQVRELYIDAVIKSLDGLETDYRIGVGGKSDDLSYVPVSYYQALEALEKFQDNRISEFSQDDNDNTYRTSKLMQLHKQIIDSMETGRYQDIYSLVESIFSILDGENLNFAYNWSINSIHDILEYFEIDKIQSVKIVYKFHFAGTGGKEAYALVKSSYLEHLEKIAEVLKSFSSSPNEEIIKKACDIIDRDYSRKEFSLYDIANELNISYGYLCTIFKQRTGCNFTEYLVSVRMKNARRIILEGSYKMYEIADMVGYNTARYFALAFRKYYGVSPSDYKKRLGGEMEQE